MGHRKSNFIMQIKSLLSGFSKVLCTIKCNEVAVLVVKGKKMVPSMI